MADQGNRTNERSQSNSSPSNHLPECSAHYEFGTILNDCICDSLRACEQRMLDDDVLAAAYHGEKGYAMGYAVALDAAEAAVAAECHHDDPNEWCVYVEAIRALKDKP